jgi:hypothetical protein
MVHLISLSRVGVSLSARFIPENQVRRTAELKEDIRPVGNFSGTRLKMLQKQ